MKRIGRPCAMGALLLGHALLLTGCTGTPPDAGALEAAVLCFQGNGVQAELDDGVIVMTGYAGDPQEVSDSVVEECIPEQAEVER